MKFFRRSLLPVAIATLLPTLAFATIAVYFAYQDHRSTVEEAAIARARAVMTDVDGRLLADLSALNVLATSLLIDSQNWKIYSQRLERALHDNGHWHAIALIDAASGEAVAGGARDSDRSASPIGGDAAGAIAKAEHFTFRTIPRERSPDGTAWIDIYLPVDRGGVPRYLLQLTITPLIFQNILVARTPANSTSGIVDRDGLFLARNLDYASRVGTPGTRFVREAVATGARSGFYAGVTYEGFKNYTAFYRSELTGWSAHIALASTLIDRNKSWSLFTIGVAAAISLALGSFLVIVVAKDLADRQRAEARLYQAQKMEALGQLTGGVAHDFNNLLTAIIGNLELVSTRLTGDPTLKRRTDNALEAAQRAARLTARLLAFSRTRAIDPTAVDLKELVSGLGELLHHSIGPQVALDIEIDERARNVMGDANQIEMALINLAVNARDAMPDGGALTISTTAYEPKRGDHLPAGSYVELCVTDTGTGMDEDTRRRALEPFFTTKPDGQGTGLGLAQVFGMVRQSGGHLVIDSEKGLGTRISMILPQATPAALARRATPGKSPEAAQPGAQTPLRILVVDDEAAIRDLVCETLTSLGHSCQSASGLDEARAHLGGGRFDLVVTDYSMPGYSGADLAREARAREADIRVLFISGFADANEIKNAVADAPVLRKPFTRQELEEAIARLIETARIPRA